MADAKQPSSHTERARVGVSSHSAVRFGVFPHPEVSWKALFHTARAHPRQQELTAAKRKDAAFLAGKGWKAAACFPPCNAWAPTKQSPKGAWC